MLIRVPGRLVARKDERGTSLGSRRVCRGTGATPRRGTTASPTPASSERGRKGETSGAAASGQAPGSWQETSGVASPRFRHELERVGRKQEQYPNAEPGREPGGCVAGEEERHGKEGR